ncbi:MAG: hydroxysqualene dehydroxylase HpnE [Pseudomonadota bacterium]
MAKQVAVIGGGWAGCAAALELSERGCTVTLFEASRTLGGRARGVEVNGKLLDNGQHILLGAYSATLRVMKLAGVDAGTALLSLPLQMRYPDTHTGMDFVAPRLPAPLHLLGALMRAKGLAWADKMALSRFSTTARWMDWQLNVDCSVAELLARFDQTERLIQLMWRPLCLAALNTPPERASARVFLNVLRDSLGARRAASDMLLPRRNLSALFPDAAARKFTVRLGTAINDLAEVAGFDAVVLATPPAVAARLAPQAGIPAFDYEPITTCYLQYTENTRLPLPFYALVDDAAAGRWGQFVFDRGQLDAEAAGLMAVVVSASGEAAALDQAALAEAIGAQLGLGTPLWSRVITEKRATFACTPNLQRPDNRTPDPRLVLAGDYTKSDYPATIEAAVRSGVAAARLLA